MAAPPDFPPVPTTREDLLIAGLRHANVTANTLNQIRTEVARLLGGRSDDARFNHLHDLLRRSCFEESGVSLFIAANNLRIDLPADLKGDSES